MMQQQSPSYVPPMPLPHPGTVPDAQGPSITTLPGQHPAPQPHPHQMGHPGFPGFVPGMPPPMGIQQPQPIGVGMPPIGTAMGLQPMPPHMLGPPGAMHGSMPGPFNAGMPPGAMPPPQGTLPPGAMPGMPPGAVPGMPPGAVPGAHLPYGQFPPHAGVLPQGMYPPGPGPPGPPVSYGPDGMPMQDAGTMPGAMPPQASCGDRVGEEQSCWPSWAPNTDFAQGAAARARRHALAFCSERGFRVTALAAAQRVLAATGPRQCRLRCLPPSAAAPEDARCEVARRGRRALAVPAEAALALFFTGAVRRRTQRRGPRARVACLCGVAVRRRGGRAAGCEAVPGVGVGAPAAGGHAVTDAGCAPAVAWRGCLMAKEKFVARALARAKGLHFSINEGLDIEALQDHRSIRVLAACSLALAGVPGALAARPPNATAAAPRVRPAAAPRSRRLVLAAASVRQYPSSDPEGLPEQGYSGQGVAHRNSETSTEDWGAEYGRGPSRKVALRIWRPCASSRTANWVEDRRPL
ncbi:unnamed protein product [Prorocentrum cordatum]|uniref:Uncharacterized protein n=1 Tax=Prorocentrum cordatum TaxID=2364126 RepID=A0ABN9SSE2_9DINO|nr:unnamed protein product [Polarella glacialis]